MYKYFQNVIQILKEKKKCSVWNLAKNSDISFDKMKTIIKKTREKTNTIFKIQMVMEWNITMRCSNIDALIFFQSFTLKIWWNHNVLSLSQTYKLTLYSIHFLYQLKMSWNFHICTILFSSCGYISHYKKFAKLRLNYPTVWAGVWESLEVLYK